ncbi:hypothetical protein GCM10008961_27030 [Deinococcus knuensis]|uniref:Uncharacterized protein n=1 Tax=Deinococcus knuensis TaxID=1837380 RepID=A0ABQ2SLW8_9DEIO|nr:hypothetical protein GCM10008961_27030 [Deinococcus knuensis]
MLPHPPAPYPRGAGGAGVALGKSLFRRGGVAVGGDVSGFDAILPPPSQARALRARRPVVVCGNWPRNESNPADRLQNPLWLKPKK